MEDEKIIELFFARSETAIRELDSKYGKVCYSISYNILNNNMNKKTYKTIAIIALVVSIIGLVSFIGGIKPVNIGACVFPLLISVIFFWIYKKTY